MRYKATFVAGFATGYVLGAKAGQRRYEQIVDTARKVMGQPAVQRFTETAKAEASDLVESAKRAMTDKVGGQDVTSDVSAGVRV